MPHVNIPFHYEIDQQSDGLYLAKGKELDFLCGAPDRAALEAGVETMVKALLRHRLDDRDLWPEE